MTAVGLLSLEITSSLGMCHFALAAINITSDGVTSILPGIVTDSVQFLFLFNSSVYSLIS